MQSPSTPIEPLTPSQIADLRLAASKLFGVKRRAFQAAMSLKYCQGSPRLTETVFGWGRNNVAVGLAERRTGIICLGRQAMLWGRQTLGGAVSRKPQPPYES